MEIFKRLSIKDYRGIDSLTFEDLSCVNVLLGENNSGKSSVLETLVLMCNMSNPDILLQINSLRARKMYSGVSDLKYFFRNMEVGVVPEIEVEDSSRERRHLSLSLSLETGKSADYQNVRLGESVLVNTIRMNFDISGENEMQSYNAYMRVDSNGIIVEKKAAEGYFEKKSISFISAGMQASNIVNDLTELFRRNMKGEVLRLLQLFDEKITGIEILKDDVYLSYSGIAEMLPASMVGDGLRRYISIVAASANPQTSVVLIDEIDNGLHYSVYNKLWHAIISLSISGRKQIFVTTHSRETLCALRDVLKSKEEWQNIMRLYTIVRTLKKGHQAYKYTYEGLNGACESDIEIR